MNTQFRSLHRVINFLCIFIQMVSVFLRVSHPYYLLEFCRVSYVRDLYQFGGRLSLRELWCPLLYLPHPTFLLSSRFLSIWSLFHLIFLLINLYPWISFFLGWCSLVEILSPVMTANLIPFCFFIPLYPSVVLTGGTFSPFMPPTLILFLCWFIWIVFLIGTRSIDIKLIISFDFWCNFDRSS